MIAGLTFVNCVNVQSEKIFDLREHALVGISPFNGSYTEDNLKKLFHWS
ncbi:MAG: hypothetical protein LBS81_03255 [Endomicrobium sp.]|jgi:tRNA-dependent cyclodipeptide synthase|nr:hypothetical protein [Endomicrobium sp.]